MEGIYSITKVDPWFLNNIKEIISLEEEVLSSEGNISKDLFLKAKEYGFSDKQLACLLGKTEEEIAGLRRSLDINPSFKIVDTCAAEFKAHTPYFYSTYEQS